MANQLALDVIQVKNPCLANWDDMSGNDQRRLCSGCGKFVHNLSAMPAEQAERLVCENAGNLCVRFARDLQSGQTLTLNYADAPKSSRRRAVATIASILTAVGLAGCITAYKLTQKKPSPTPPPKVQMLMGEIAPCNLRLKNK